MATHYFMVARVLQVVAELDLLTHLAAGPHSAISLATQLGVDVLGLEMLLNTCMALQLVVQTPAGYVATSAGAAALDRRQPGYLGHVLAATGAIYRDWADLDEAIRSGEPVAAPTRMKDPTSHRQLVLANHASSGPIAEAVARLVPLRPNSLILDVGGGAGTFAMALCRQQATARATVIDLPEVTPIAQEVINRVGLQARVRTVALDYHRTPLPINQDIVIVANVLHQESSATAAALLQQLFAALRREGQVLIIDIMQDEQQLPALPVALGSLNQFLHHPQSRYYTIQEVQKLLHAAGLRVQKCHSLPMRDLWLLIASKV